MESAGRVLSVKTDPSSLALGTALGTSLLIRRHFRRRLAPVAPKIVKSRVTGLECAVVPLWYGGVLGIPSIYILTRVLDFANYASPGARVWATAAGGLTAALALWLFARSHSDLGSLWSVSLQLREQHKLMKSGVYAHVRHPMYASGLLLCAGIGILAPNWVVNAGVLGAMAALLFVRIPKEEQMMIEEFGEDYQRYKSDVGGIVPKLKIWPQRRRREEAS
ncbi:unnamed protein product [Ostreobium quekettii]|uniref:Protein-S-isoprenylcysteine O-methyltransferase n=1 Tax=Ostreobium quekettii TaxID=121088 RepID=A0A8S1J6X4_9CHLO|nr:unnamed protein product [Ostreobium quekettii]